MHVNIQRNCIEVIFIRLDTLRIKYESSKVPIIRTRAKTIGSSGAVSLISPECGTGDALVTNNIF